MLTRRGLITGLMGLIAAPAVVRAASLMPVKAIEPDWTPGYIVQWVTPDGWEHKGIIRLQYKVIELSDQDRVEMQQAQMAAITEAAVLTP